MGQLTNASGCQGWRFVIYGVILIYLLFFYFKDSDFSAAGANDEKDVSQSVAGVRKQNETEPIGDSPKLRSENTPLNSIKDLGNYPDIYANKTSFVKRQVKQLLKSRKTFYAESRTLSASEVVDLHNVKDNEDYPAAITNEALLILRELAIEHRIPQECSEEVTAECLVILERSQAGLMPIECLHPQYEEECEGAFARFWDS